MSSRDGSRCRGCGQPIRWVATRDGKAMPCDPELISEWIMDDAPARALRPNVTLVDPDGEIQTGHRTSLLAPASRNVTGYLPHWITCPRASEFRR